MDAGDVLRDVVVQSVNASAQVGSMPVSCSMLRRQSSSVNGSMPQSVSWMSMITHDAEQALPDRQRAQPVLGHEAAGVADHMGVTFGQAQQAGDVEARIRAGDDRDLVAGGSGRSPLSKSAAYRPRRPQGDEGATS